MQHALTTNFLNNCIIQLLDLIEEKCDVKFVTFTDSDVAENHNGGVNSNQPYMQQASQSTGTVYKYLYDPGLSFNFRFHQYLSDVAYAHKDEPWTTLMFSTGPVRPLTRVLSHKYEGYEFVNFSDEIQDYIPFKTRRVRVPVQFAVISNNLTYLYGTCERIASYFDRAINFPYNQTIRYSKDKVIQWQVIGQCINIEQTDVAKLETEDRGTIATATYSFDLIHWVTDAPEAPLNLLEKIILEIRDGDVKGPLIKSIEITDEGIIETLDDTINNTP